MNSPFDASQWLRYAGADWCAMALTFAAVRLLAARRRAGFLVMIAGNLCWAGVGWLSGSGALVAANATFALNNFVAWKQWHPEKR